MVSHSEKCETSLENRHRKPRKKSVSNRCLFCSQWKNSNNESTMQRAFSMWRTILLRSRSGNQLSDVQMKAVQKKTLSEWCFLRRKSQNNDHTWRGHCKQFPNLPPTPTSWLLISKRWKKMLHEWGSQRCN